MRHIFTRLWAYKLLDGGISTEKCIIQLKRKFVKFSESILSTGARPFFITNKCIKERYNIHVFIQPEFKILKCRPELENIEVSND